MGLGVDRWRRLPSWVFMFLSVLVWAACEPANGDESEGARPDAEGASEGAPSSDAGDSPATSDSDEEAPSAPDDAGVILVPHEVSPTADGVDAAVAAPVIPPPVDICGPVPTSGRCRGEQEVELCVVATGMGEQRLDTYTCAADKHCVETAGHPRCVLRTDCSVGTTRCADGALETCAGDHWDTQVCTTECVATPLGAFCAAAAPTRRFAGRVQYERRLPNAKLSDWAGLTLAPARGFLVLSYHADELVDAVLSGGDETAQAGTFSLRVRAQATAEDSIVVMAAGADANQQLAYAVADPGFEPSLRAHEPGTNVERAAIWSYRFALRDVPAEGLLTIMEVHGSAACHVFDRVRQVYTLAHDHYQPKHPEPLVVWLGLGTQWNCGACTAWNPMEAFDTQFEHQIWLDGSRDQGYWSDSATAHELGHYVMNAYGFPLGEGGPHYLGVPTQPGQAFSEGWATFFSSMARTDSVYFDKQGGAFFWWDLDRRAYSPLSLLWGRASPWLGLFQLMDENEAAAMLWQTYRAIGAPGPVLDAIASDRMRLSPFARGYKRRIWSNAAYPNVFDTTEQSLPCLADFFDALLCSGSVEADALSEIVEPSVHYPYASGSPLCR